ncbi:nucleotide sugar dehydrogenase [Candidatus Hydrogenosomobacter endosymbioticus]|uniref:UDP-N-acetyl-D-glucosamine dehydrogenase n=1 Tax=Candidatus Hydrogenosomobacter endosymbioticus TaxID=2558174 RepID=A0ABM7V9G6_9PROT|nr:nucleotide sugar dehydrogenase [Candidatus Hydrogenosomobacter endosymbioticus]BDB96451.1 UDP-N-acetyl-D-glucosamine dehydrogenase [Candidatus Hydrogenosomobacter endosymbioticus]
MGANLLAERAGCGGFIGDSGYLSLFEMLKNKTARICVMGLGYVGLPLAKALCESGYHVFGVDPDSSKVNSLVCKKSYISSVKNCEVECMLDSSRFFVSCDFEQAIFSSDVVIICVPTPLTQNRDPDMRYVLAAMNEIANAAYGSGTKLVILESTTYPGTMRQIAEPILRKSMGEVGKDYFMAYCPEREDPGNKEFHTNSIPKVVGAADRESLELAASLYGSVVPSVIKVSSWETAESVKLMENIFRFVNISLVNEMKMIFQKLGVDVWEVIEAASTKPFGYMPFYPGSGIGGHCIPVDPVFLNWKIKSSGMRSLFIDAAIQLNEDVENFVVGRVAYGLDWMFGKGLRGSRILVVGVAYKANVNDFRESPALNIFKKLNDRGAIVNYYDPFIERIDDAEESLSLNGVRSVELSENYLRSQDAVLICTPHDGVDYRMILNNSKLIVDSKNVYKNVSAKNIVRA